MVYDQIAAADLEGNTLASLDDEVLGLQGSRAADLLFPVAFAGNTLVSADGDGLVVADALTAIMPHLLAQIVLEGTVFVELVGRSTLEEITMYFPRVRRGSVGI